MAPSKQSSRQSKVKDLIGEAVKDDHSRLVSEPGEGGMSSSNSDEVAQIRRAQDQLLAVVSNMSAKLDLLLQSKMENGGNRGILDNREGIGTSHVRVSANGVVVNDHLQGTRHEFNVEEQTISFAGTHQQGVPKFGMEHDREQEDQLLSSGSRRHQDDYLQGIHRPLQQEEFLMHAGNRQYGVFRRSVLFQPKDYEALVAEVKMLQEDKENLRLNLKRAEEEVALLSEENWLLDEENKSIMRRYKEKKRQSSSGTQSLSISTKSKRERRSKVGIHDAKVLDLNDSESPRQPLQPIQQNSLSRTSKK